MKIKFIIIISLSIWFGCGSQAQIKNIEINLDTINLCVYGDLKTAIVFKDNFYCMFETNRENTTKDYKKMVVFNQNGEFIEDVFLPEGIQNMNYYRIAIENDSLFLKRTQFEEETFSLGKYVSDFEQINRRYFPIFEDDEFEIYSSCNGEWGGTVYFQDKETKKVYEAGSTCPKIVNKINDEYYVTNYLGHMIGFTSVLKIKEPRKLKESKLNFKRNNGSRFNEGVENILDTMDFYISSSFVIDNELLHLYADEEGTYLGKVENQKMKREYEFDYHFYSGLDQSEKGKFQTLSIYFPKTEEHGILIFKDEKFTIKKIEKNCSQQSIQRQ